LLPITVKYYLWYDMCVSTGRWSSNSKQITHSQVGVLAVWTKPKFKPKQTKKVSNLVWFGLKPNGTNLNWSSLVRYLVFLFWYLKNQWIKLMLTSLFVLLILSLLIHIPHLWLGKKLNPNIKYFLVHLLSSIIISSLKFYIIFTKKENPGRLLTTWCFSLLLRLYISCLFFHVMPWNFKERYCIMSWFILIICINFMLVSCLEKYGFSLIQFVFVIYHKKKHYHICRLYFFYEKII